VRCTRWNHLAEKEKREGVLRGYGETKKKEGVLRVAERRKKACWFGGPGRVFHGRSPVAQMRAVDNYIFRIFRPSTVQCIHIPFRQNSQRTRVGLSNVGHYVLVLTPCAIHDPPKTDPDRGEEACGRYMELIGGVEMESAVRIVSKIR
jgi:hypothetical protein